MSYKQKLYTLIILKNGALFYQCSFSTQERLNTWRFEILEKWMTYRNLEETKSPSWDYTNGVDIFNIRTYVISNINEPLELDLLKY